MNEIPKVVKIGIGDRISERLLAIKAGIVGPNLEEQVEAANFRARRLYVDHLRGKQLGQVNVARFVRWGDGGSAHEIGRWDVNFQDLAEVVYFMRFVPRMAEVLKKRRNPRLHQNLFDQITGKGSNVQL